MFALVVSIGNQVSKQWEVVSVFDLEQNFGGAEGMHCLPDGRVVLPNGELLICSASLYEGSLAMSIIVRCRNREILNLGGFKQQLNTGDPTAFFLTPDGSHVSVHVVIDNELKNDAVEDARLQLVQS